MSSFSFSASSVRNHHHRIKLGGLIRFYWSQNFHKFSWIFTFAYNWCSHMTSCVEFYYDYSRCVWNFSNNRYNKNDITSKRTTFNVCILIKVYKYHILCMYIFFILFRMFSIFANIMDVCVFFFSLGSLSFQILGKHVNRYNDKKNTTIIRSTYHIYYSARNW